MYIWIMQRNLLSDFTCLNNFKVFDRSNTVKGTMGAFKFRFEIYSLEIYSYVTGKVTITRT